MLPCSRKIVGSSHSDVMLLRSVSPVNPRVSHSGDTTNESLDGHHPICTSWIEPLDKKLTGCKLIHFFIILIMHKIDDTKRKITLRTAAKFGICSSGCFYSDEVTIYNHAPASIVWN